MKTIELSPGVRLVQGAANCGLLVSGDAALLIDCDASCTPDALAALGITNVDRVLCTQHRRGALAGVEQHVARGAEVTVPRGARELFEDVESFWNDPKNRWHPYHVQPGPQVLARSVPVSDDVAKGDVIEWKDFRIRVFETPGTTDTAVSYLVEGEGILFCGDAMYGPGQVHDVHSLQKGFKGVGDYHGFIGNYPQLRASLQQLMEEGADRWAPGHGDVIENPAAAAALTIERMDELERNHAAITSMNFYFPRLYTEFADDPLRMTPVETRPFPEFVLRPGAVSFLLLSDTGAGLLIDCGQPKTVEHVNDLLESGKMTTLDLCWVTHYHDDHVDALSQLPAGVPIWTDETVCEVIEHPERFFLPCISDKPAEVARTFAVGETWDWHEFHITVVYMPGQTHYHNGLVVEGHGTKLFFVGDSASPTGIEDHCTQNRVFIGAGRGYRHCVDLWREHRPDHMFNQHQDRSFHYDDEQLDYIEKVLVDREALYRELLPWEDPNFGVDQNWIRAYPYEQTARAGATIDIGIQMTNHAAEARVAEVIDLDLPDGWECAGLGPAVTIPSRVDGYASASVRIPASCSPGGYVLPFTVRWNGVSLGPIRHAVVNVESG